MSGQNVKVIQRFHEAFNHSDFDDVREFMHPETELHPGYVGLDVSSGYRGHHQAETLEAAGLRH